MSRDIMVNCKESVGVFVQNLVFDLVGQKGRDYKWSVDEIAEACDPVITKVVDHYEKENGLKIFAKFYCSEIDKELEEDNVIDIIKGRDAYIVCGREANYEGSPLQIAYRSFKSGYSVDQKKDS